MKKSVLLVLALILSEFATAQQNQLELFQSNLYFKASYSNEVTDFQSLMIRESIQDTLIGDQNFKKYSFISFIDWDKEKSFDYYYESFDGEGYKKLDRNHQVIHSFQFKEGKQNGILFGQKTDLEMEYVDTRTSYPRDSLIPTPKTPQKYYSAGKSENHLIISPYFQTNLMEYENEIYTKLLVDDMYWTVSKNLDNGLTVSNAFNNQVGDEIQLVYRRKWYDEDTDEANYETKQFKNFKIIGIQKEADSTRIQLKINGFNFLSSIVEQEQDWEITLGDNAYHLDYMKIPVQTYGQELRIEDKVLKLQTVVEETIGSTKFPLVKSIYSGEYYQPTLVPFFPMVFYAVGNVEGYISFVKLHGVEYGEKLESSFTTDETSLWAVKTLDQNWIEVRFFVAQDSEIEIEIGQNNEMKSVFKKQLKVGEYTEKLKVNSSSPDAYFQLNFSYKSEEAQGMISTGFYTP